jgi:hypothetical protein
MDSVSAPLCGGGGSGSREDKYLRKLIDGKGISDEVWNGLVEKCSKCRSVFTASALKVHVKRCLGLITILWKSS